MTFKYVQYVRVEVDLVSCELLLVWLLAYVMNSTSPAQVATRAKKDVVAPAIPALMPIN